MKEPATCEIADFFANPSQFDCLIDTRSPSEFDLDHIPGALNLPVLNDAERETVGKINAQRSSFDANRIGASLVSANIARILDGPLSGKPRTWRVAVYCWRGGNRSGSLATVLARIGWQTTVLAGGYRAYRRWLLNNLAHWSARLNFRVIAGRTGSGKSRILQALSKHGAQVLDLESLARHRGSVLGLMPSDQQPSQKYFDSVLGQSLRVMDADRPVYVESESRKIGHVQLPGELIDRIRRSPCHVIEMPARLRAQYLLQDYPHFVADPESLKRQLDRLKTLHGDAKIKQWHHLIDAGNYAEFVQTVLTTHYDPAYDRSMSKNFEQLPAAHWVHLGGESPGSFNDWFESAAGQILSNAC